MKNLKGLVSALVVAGFSAGSIGCGAAAGLVGEAGDATDSDAFGDYEGTWKFCEYMSNPGMDMKRVVTAASSGAISFKYEMYSSTDGSCGGTHLADMGYSGTASLSSASVTAHNEESLDAGLVSALVGLDISISDSYIMAIDDSILGMITSNFGVDSPVVDTHYPIPSDMAGPGIPAVGGTKYVIAAIYDGQLYWSATQNTSQGFTAETREDDVVGPFTLGDSDSDSDSASDSDSDSDASPMAAYVGLWSECKFNGDMGMDLSKFWEIAADGAVTYGYRFVDSTDASCAGNPVISILSVGVASLPGGAVVLHDSEAAGAEDAVNVNIAVSESYFVGHTTGGVNMIGGMLSIAPPAIDAPVTVSSNMNGSGMVPAGQTKYTIMSISNGIFYGGLTSGANQGFTSETRDYDLSDATTNLD